MRIALLIVALLTTGCTQVLASFRVSDDVTMDVIHMESSPTGFDVKVEFREHDKKHRYLIQEGDLGNLYFVECWETRGDGSIRGYDRHWTKLVDSAGLSLVVRRFKVYTGTVEGVDLTDRTYFGMLPQNQDGSVVTNIDPEYFNHDNYFGKGHRLQGTIVERAQVFGTWQLSWQSNQVRIDVGNEFIAWNDGAYVVFQVGKGAK